MKRFLMFTLILGILAQTVCISAFGEVFTGPDNERVRILYDREIGSIDITLGRFQAEADATVLTAVYKNDVLFDAFLDTYTAGSLRVDFDTKTVETGILEGASDFKFKFFVWGDTLNPLRAPYDINDYEYGIVLAASDAEKSIEILADTGEKKTYSLTDSFKIESVDVATSFAEFEALYRDSIVYDYVRYKPAGDKIDVLYQSGYWGYDHKGTDVLYNKNTRSLGQNPVDKDSVVYFLGYDEAGNVVPEETTVGTLDDLEDGLCYSYVAYSCGFSIDTNRIVISGIKVPVYDTGYVAVVTEAISDFDEYGQEVLYISYLHQGEEGYAFTTNEVYSAYKDSLTKGDIIQFEMTDGVIDKIDKLVDFSEEIRDKETGLISATAFVNGQVSYEGDKGEYNYGYATDYDSMRSNAVVNGNTYRLDKAENIYVIDVNGKNVRCEIGSYENFEWDDSITEDYDKNADWLFIRTFDDVLKDVVIIKKIL